MKSKCLRLPIPSDGRWQNPSRCKAVLKLNYWYTWQQKHFLEFFDLRGAFFRVKKYIPAVNYCKTVYNSWQQYYTVIYCLQQEGTYEDYNQ